MNIATPAEVERLIRAFESQGDHRTGSAGDHECTVWLIDELASSGIKALAQTFTFPRLTCKTTELRVDAETIPGVPLFDGGLTGRHGIVAPLVERSSAPDAIALLRFDADMTFFGPNIYDALQAAAKAGTRGVVIVAGDDLGAPVVRNAERIDDPLPLPVLQIAPRDAGPLRDGVEVTLTIDACRDRGSATNVVATLPGTDPEAAPVVFMTPKSGWFTCAAERGGGHAVWLTAAAAIARADTRRPLWLVCSGGHELHHYGLAAYLESMSIACSDTHCWVHLGASIGAREPLPLLGAADGELQRLMIDALSEAGALERIAMPVGNPGAGEARNIAERDGRFLTLVGGHRYFHSPNDTLDLAVDTDSVARHARAVTAVLRRLLND